MPSSALAGVSGSDSRPITGDAEEQDVFVPWELQAPRIPKPKKPSAMTKAERAAAKLAAEEQAAAEAAAAATAAAPVEPKPTFQRYYHLFRQYELSSLFLAAAQSLGATFDAPKDYPLASEVDTVADELARTRISAAAGEWQVQVEIKEERWERENWVVEAAVRWVAR